jgi:hypothetical protein
MNHRVPVDFVDPAPSVAADVIYFAYSPDPLGSGDIRLAVIYAQGTGYRVSWDYPGLGDYAHRDIKECEAHIVAHALACIEAYVRQVELSN